MVLISFTRKFEDKTEKEGAGFQFVFYCEVGEEPVESIYVESHAAKKSSTTRLFGKSLSEAGEIAKKFGGFKIPGVSGKTEKDIEEGLKTGGELAEKGEGIAEELAKQMGPEWHREHDKAFEDAQNEVKKVFNQCPACNRWACIHCWNSQKGLCIEDAKNTVLCPACHQPAGAGKFCNNCGKSLVLTCPKCGKTHAPDTKFCEDCGASLS